MNIKTFCDDQEGKKTFCILTNLWTSCRSNLGLQKSGHDTHTRREGSEESRDLWKVMSLALLLCRGSRLMNAEDGRLEDVHGEK